VQACPAKNKRGQKNKTPLLRELDRACYAGGDWRGKKLAETLATFPDTRDTSKDKATELASLYP
jgi:hypothetical protein